MLKKKYIKRAYIEIPYCHLCGAEMRHTGIILDSYPAQYPYKCTNPNCNGYTSYYDYERPGRIKYEFEEDEEDV